MDAAKAAAQQLKKINMDAHKKPKLKVRKALLDALDRAIGLDRRQTTPAFAIAGSEPPSPSTLTSAGDMVRDR